MRALSLSSQNGGALVLLPWGDFVNHDTRCSCSLDWDDVLQAVVLTADRDYSVGQQVCECGRASSARMCKKCEDVQAVRGCASTARMCKHCEDVQAVRGCASAH